MREVSKTTSSAPKTESETSSSARPGFSGLLEGIYIYGDPGAGKTMMMDMFYDRVREQGVASHRAHFHDFMLDMNKSL